MKEGENEKDSFLSSVDGKTKEEGFMKRFKARQSYFLFILILSVLLTTGCTHGGGHPGQPATPPTVTFTTPVNGATGVATNTRIAVTFSKAMDPSTLTAATFTLTQGGAAVSGTFKYSGDGLTWVFTPASNLATGNLATGPLCTATITTGAKDAAGNALASNYVWSFTTGAAPDTTAPTVTSTVPANGATGVGTNTKIAATFSKAMDPTTITAATFTLSQGGTAVPGTVTYSGFTAVFAPAAGILLANSPYIAEITTGAKDLTNPGNALASSYGWSFTTGAGPDTGAPTVTLTAPVDLTTGVCINATFAATFSKAMDPTTISAANVTVTSGSVTGPSVPVSFFYDPINYIGTFTPTSYPTSYLTPGTKYFVAITTGVKDVAGNALASNYGWSFTTGTTTCTSPVALGSAAVFGSMGGGAGVTNTGLSIINGDIGTTGAMTLITGFVGGGTPATPGVVNGTIYSGTLDYPLAPAGSPDAIAPGTIAAAAVADANTAFINLSPAALPGGIDVSSLGGGAGELGGRTLAPGIYTSAPGTFEIIGSDLTLDAGGDPNAVWVFQMASSLTVGAPGFPRSVIPIRGAQAKNVFWQVGSAATINAAGGGTMVGNIIAQAGVSFSTAGVTAITTLNGRALALVGPVTMVSTYVNVPAP